mgnify:CR=1 FL=1
MIFQHPTSALNPVLSIGYQIAEPIMEHRKLGSKDAWVEVKEMLSAVRIPRPDIYAHAFPHQISGGMKQRSLAAMALSWQPRLLLADEPTTMLDTTTQARFLELLKEIQRDSGIAILLVTPERIPFH